jgi:hypothetical protein
MDNAVKEIKELLKQINDEIVRKDLKSVEVHYNQIRDLAISKQITNSEIVLEIQNTYKRIAVLVESLKSKPAVAPNFNSDDLEESKMNAQNSKIVIPDNNNSRPRTEKSERISAPQNPPQKKQAEEEYDPDRISPEEFEAMEKDEAKKAGKKYKKDDDSSSLLKKEKAIEQLYDFKSVSRKIADLNEQLNELMIKTEKNEGKWERQNSVNDSMNNTIMMLKEDIGGFRSTILIREQAADKMDKAFERLKDMVETINPDKVNKRFEKMDTSIETIGAKVDKHDMMVEKNAKEVLDYKQIMSKIKSYDNLFNVLNQIKDGVNQMQKVKADADRIASKMEVMFSEVNRKLRVIDSVEQKMSSFETILKDTLKNVDLFDTRLKDTAKESSINEISSDLEGFKSQVANFNAKLNDFGLDLVNTQKNISKIDDVLHVINDTLLTTESKQFKLDLETNSKISKQLMDDVIEFQNTKLKNLLSKFETEINLSKKEDARKTYDDVKSLMIKLAPVSKANVIEETKRAKDLIEKYNNVVKAGLSQLDKKENQ